MGRTKTPIILWDFYCQYTVDLCNRLARPLPQLHGRTPHEVLTGNTPDIPEYLEFKSSDLIWFYEPSTFPEENKHLARWISISHHVGQAMCYWLLSIPIARTIIQKVPQEELQTEAFQTTLKSYNDMLEEKLSDENMVPQTLQLYQEDEDANLNDDQPFEPEALVPEEANIEADTYDELLVTEPMLEREGILVQAQVIGRKRDPSGNLMGHYHSNPLLNTCVYMVSLPDGHIAEYSAYKIAESIYQNANNDGMDQLLFGSIIGHKSDLHSNQQTAKSKYTTTGWRICISWKDGTTS